jgi:hypothetical protein
LNRISRVQRRFGQIDVGSRSRRGENEKRGKDTRTDQAPHHHPGWVRLVKPEIEPGDSHGRRAAGATTVPRCLWKAKPDFDRGG